MSPECQADFTDVDRFLKAVEVLLGESKWIREQNVDELLGDVKSQLAFGIGDQGRTTVVASWAAPKRRWRFRRVRRDS